MTVFLQMIKRRMIPTWCSRHRRDAMGVFHDIQGHCPNTGLQDLHPCYMETCIDDLHPCIWIYSICTAGRALYTRENLDLLDLHCRSSTVSMYQRAIDASTCRSSNRYVHIREQSVRAGTREQSIGTREQSMRAGRAIDASTCINVHIGVEIRAGRAIDVPERKCAMTVYR